MCEALVEVVDGVLAGGEDGLDGGDVAIADGGGEGLVAGFAVVGA